MNLLDIVRQHRALAVSIPAMPACEESEKSELTHPARGGDGLNSLSSLPSRDVPVTISSLDRCRVWLERYIKGRYPPLAEVKSAAATAGFAAADVAAALVGPTFVLYKAFPRRYVGEVEKIRTIDDWPDDPPLNNQP